MMIEELYIMSKFENWTKTGITGFENPRPLDEPAFSAFKDFQQENHLHWMFLATRSGITAYWQFYHLANEEHIRYEEILKVNFETENFCFFLQTIW